MVFENLQSLFVFVILFVPGAIIVKIYGARYQSNSHIDIWLDYLLWSLVNYGVAWLFISMSHEDKVSLFASVVVLLVCPVLIGILLVLNRKFDWWYSLMKKTGLKPIHDIPCAWDWRFARLDSTTPYWILITLKNGGKPAGIFGDKSFASSDPSQRDIYIEQVYHFSGKGWVQSDPGHGALISANEILMIDIQPLQIKGS